MDVVSKVAFEKGSVGGVEDDIGGLGEGEVEGSSWVLAGCS